jgi:hypothetical protein
MGGYISLPLAMNVVRHDDDAERARYPQVFWRYNPDINQTPESQPRSLGYPKGRSGGLCGGATLRNDEPLVSSC